MIWKDTYAPVFTAALLTVAKAQKHPKCPSTEEWVKMWYLYTYAMQYYSAITKKEIIPFAAMWMDLLSYWVKSEEKYCMASLICGIEKKMIQMNLQNRKILTDLEN